MLTEEQKARYSDAIAIRKVDNERAVFLLPLLYNSTRLAVGRLDDDGYDDFYDYDSEHLYDALKAVLDWDGVSEPPDGWCRARRIGEYDYRRRPHGDPALEHRAP